MITKDSIWHVHDGRMVAFKDLEDTHLANLIHYLKKVQLMSYKEILKVLRSIAKERGLTTKFLRRSQIPYKNEYERWEIWDGKNPNSFIEISKEMNPYKQLH